MFAEKVSYPVLVRPSFVLSGAAMNVATNPEQLTSYLGAAAHVSGDKPVVVTKFVTNAKEIEFDAVALNGRVLNYAISEHVENAGVHSGDATLVLPAQNLYQETVRRIKKIGQAIASALRITGPFNVQLMAKSNDIKVIECNLRASRSFPFVSKTLNANFITLATKAMLGLPAKPYAISLSDIDYVAVKAPMFSFTRLRGADPTLGVEMASTGEVACFGESLHEAFRLAIEATGFKLPPAGGGVLVSIAKSDDDQALDRRYEFRESVQKLHSMGYRLFATPGTAHYYRTLGVPVQTVTKPLKDPARDRALSTSDYASVTTGSPTAGKRGAGKAAAAAKAAAGKVASGASAMDLEEENAGVRTAIELIKAGKIDLVINVPEGGKKESVSNGYLLRRTTVDFGVALLTNVKVAKLFVESEERHRAAAAAGAVHPPKTIHEYYRMGKDV